jgi:phenylpropionate dioxygenase-like ring-hydroxylating dioxygenase large terminal subunit
MSLDQALSDLLETAKRPMEDALAMPPELYINDEYVTRELENVFGKDWVAVGRSSSVAQTGDYMSFELAGQPIVVLRDKSGELSAFSNVCLHRMSTIVEGTGNARVLVCPYHAWTYDLEGNLRGAPFMKETTGFCKESYKLPKIRCEEWLGWIYVSLDPEIESVASQLGELEAMISHYKVEDYVECFRETHVWDTNWKVLAENFMESYHLPVCHAATVGGYSKLNEMECPPGLKHFNYHWITKEASLEMGNAHPNNTRLKGDERKTTALITIYPSHLITLTPGYFWYLSLRPKGAGQVEIVYGGGLSPEFMEDPKADEYMETLKTLLDDVNVEDRGCTEKVYKGMNADAAKAGHLSYLERPIYDFMQYLAEKTAGFERVFSETPSEDVAQA